LNLYSLPAHRLLKLLERGEVSAEEIISSFLKRVEEVEADLNALISLFKEDSLSQAKRIDRMRGKGERPGRLAGIPIAVKDNICIKGKRTTCGSRILSDFISPYDATVVERLKKEGAIILGKTNMDEFAMGSSNENSFFGPVKNPFDRERVPGGSSGGSAAAVSSGEATMAMGSDTGGSVRLPASFCGVVGFKPTYGLVSRFGLVAFASSLDQIGPITRDVEDCVLLMEVIGGYDPRDSTSIDLPMPDFVSGLRKGIKGLKLGLPKEYFPPGIDPAVRSALNKAIDQLSVEGVEIEDISLPHTDKAIATYYILADAEASSNLARYDGARYGYRAQDVGELLYMYNRSRDEGFGDEVKRRIMLGTYVLSSGYYDAYYLHAQKARTLIRRDFEDAFMRCDLLLTPTSPTPAFKLGEKIDDPLTMYLSDIFTVTVNLAGLPSISIPCGKTIDGLPIGMQIIGPPLADDEVLRLAYAYEQLSSE
jgi:aspartyl-tRNA(Asn)/glutamyl-tRNA(Gln) amidotransferase subunit A